MGMFRDEDDMQDFVVMGSLFGLPSDKFKIPNGDGDNAITLVVPNMDSMTLVEIQRKTILIQ